MGNPIPTASLTDKTEDPSVVGTDRKSIKRNTNAVEVVEEKTSEPSSRDFPNESSVKENIELQKENKYPGSEPSGLREQEEGKGKRLWGTAHQILFC